MVNLHADDYGITVEQSKAMLELCSDNGHRPLGSVSIFANSPVFEEAAELLRPYVEGGQVDVSLHLNLVEGPSCLPGRESLLINDEGMFRDDFVKLMLKSWGPRKVKLQKDVKAEFIAQISRFTDAFPEYKGSLRIDSHQHTHMIPMVFDTMLEAAKDAGVTIRQLRIPTEDVTPYEMAGRVGDISAANRAKNMLLTHFSRRNLDRLSEYSKEGSVISPECKTPGFCGVLLSGSMDRMDDALLDAVGGFHTDAGRDVEVLFHPVSVPIEECLDPSNTAFARACASSSRDAEAKAIRNLSL